MNDVGVIIFFLIIALSHIAFGIFSTKHKISKIWVYTLYLLYGVFFMIISSLKIRFIYMFLITLPVYGVLYLSLGQGNLLKNLFLLTSYATWTVIFFGVSLTFTFINCPGYMYIRWILILLTFSLTQFLMYFYLIPKFNKSAEEIKKGWILFIIGDILFSIIIFMQIFYPFTLSPEHPGRIALFFLCALFYFFVFTIIFTNLSSAFSYYKEREKSQHLEVMAHKDSLTTLYNRAYFDIYSEELVKQHQNGSTDPTAIIVMDINKFKEVNDSYGHQRGDEVLQQVSRELLNVFNEDSYKCFRVGGDEFAVIALINEKQEIENKIIELNNNLDRNVKITVAIGYIFVEYDNVDPILTAFKKADKNMYQDKFR